jgi:hypothetical protein
MRQSDRKTASGLGALSDAESRLFVSFRMNDLCLPFPSPLGHRFSGRAHGTLEGHRAIVLSCRRGIVVASPRSRMRVRMFWSLDRVIIAAERVGGSLPIARCCVLRSQGPTPACHPRRPSTAPCPLPSLLACADTGTGVALESGSGAGAGSGSGSASPGRAALVRLHHTTPPARPPPSSLQGARAPAVVQGS